MKGRMSRVRPSTRVSAIVLAALALTIGALLFGGGATAAGHSADLPGVPHYFGPFPNWANSPTRTTRRHRHDHRQWRRSSSNSHGRRQRGRHRPHDHEPGQRLHGRDRQHFGPGSGATASAVVQTSGAVTASRSTGRPRLHRPVRHVQRRRCDDAGDGARARWRRCRLALARRGAATASRRSTSTCRMTRTVSRRPVTPSAAPRTPTATGHRPATMTVVSIVVDNAGPDTSRRRTSSSATAPCSTRSTRRPTSSRPRAQRPSRSCPSRSTPSALATRRLRQSLSPTPAPGPALMPLAATDFGAVIALHLLTEGSGTSRLASRSSSTRCPA